MTEHVSIIKHIRTIVPRDHREIMCVAIFPPVTMYASLSARSMVKCKHKNR